MPEKNVPAPIDMTGVVVTSKGAPVTGEPVPGGYYGVRAKDGVDPRAVCAALKARYPKSFFARAPGSR